MDDSRSATPQFIDFAGSLAARLFETRTILLTGEVRDGMAQAINSQLLLLDQDDPVKPINVVINSGGGSITSGFAMYDIIRGLRAPVRTIGAGIVASMGVTLFVSVPRERRFALPNVRFMIHQPLIGGTVVAPVSDVEIEAREMKKTRDGLNRLLSEATGQPMDKIEADTQRDYWMGAQEAVDYGLAHQVINSIYDLPK